jgi:hypothetical protein
MNKTIVNIFTYLVIFLAITQIINYLYNNIYGSLIFFLMLSLGLYFITNKNIPISLLLTIVITNILNVSDVLDNNLYEGRRDLGRPDRRSARQSTDKINKQVQIDKNINESDIVMINQQIADISISKEERINDINELESRKDRLYASIDLKNQELDITIAEQEGHDNELKDIDDNIIEATSKIKVFDDKLANLNSRRAGRTRSPRMS